MADYTPKLPKAGNIPITKLGHTRNTSHGSNPDAKARGAAAGSPSEITYKG